MKLIVSSIPAGGLDIDATERVDPLGAGHPAEVRLSLRAEAISSEVRLRGGLDVSLGMKCGRCLKDFIRPIDIELDLAFLPEAGLPDDDGHELVADELNTGFYRDDEIDLTELAREQVVLSLPMKPLCREDCRGICPSCGADLNAGDCKCGPRAADFRMKALETFFDKERSSDGQPNTQAH